MPDVNSPVYGKNPDRSAHGPDVDRVMPAFGSDSPDYLASYSFGAELDYEFGSIFGSIGHFVGNAAKVAGREIGHAATSVQKVGGKVGDAIGKIPVVGAPMHTVLGAAYHAAAAPVHLTIDVAIKHRRLDKALMDRVKEAGSDAKGVAPYAKMVLSSVPGIGTGAAAALGAGLALAEGQPIDKALIAGVLSSIPGGPAVRAAAEVATHGLDAAIRGEKIDLHAVGPLLKSLNLPPEAQKALETGMKMTADIASGKKVDAALADAALHEGMKYLPPDAKKAFQAGLGMGTASILQQVKAIHLPDIHNKMIESGLQLAKTVPAIGEARKLVGKGTKGFDLAHGILSQKASYFDIAHARASLKDPADKMGFDMGAASRIGLVSRRPEHKISHAAAAGRAITYGMQGMSDPTNKQAIMTAVQASPSATVGAQLAVSKIAEERLSWPVKVVRAIKGIFHHATA